MIWTSLLTYRLAPEELSEEDQQLKSELDMLVERLTVGISYIAPKSMYSDKDWFRNLTRPSTNLLSKPSRTRSRPQHRR
jgi:hypothetical protein